MATHLADANNLSWSCGTNISGKDLRKISVDHHSRPRIIGSTNRIVQISMFLKIANPPIDDGAGCTPILCTVTHESTIHCVDGPGRSRNEDHRSRRN